MASLADRIKAKKLTPEMLGMDEPAAEKTEAPAPLQSFVKEAVVPSPEPVTSITAEDYKFVAGDSASPVFAPAEDITVEEATSAPKAKRAHNKKSPPVGLAVGSVDQTEPLYFVSITYDNCTINGSSSLANLKETVVAIREALKF